MRTVLFIFSSASATASAADELIRAHDFSTFSARGIRIGDGDRHADHAFPFPCFTLDAPNRSPNTHTPASASIQYADMLQMIFESDAVVSLS